MRKHPVFVCVNTQLACLFLKIFQKLAAKNNKVMNWHVFKWKPKINMLKNSAKASIEHV